ncbi:hypothetical protein [Bradymonas sediminis]|uniref:Uncharacterized protein n=1 Tax=Bradymonas sediminis TaxID=1548548 RepID=A0A2Z4FLU8_9DELT|nr:hypothetical protein [Bradymonas sediminis]AWV89931.1 hypothetical protein DN745_11510 [Bradymonas sediminis]TDP62153.1 hypothetical protein DFR33_11415 [Bradymonas sediminis]
MSTHDKGSPDSSATLVLWLVWASMLFSLMVMASVPLIIPPPPGFVPFSIAAGTVPPIVVILAVASAMLIAVLRNARKKRYFDQAASYASAEEKDNAYFTMALTTWVICELVGVFGLVIGYLTFEALLALPFLLVAATLLGIYRPKSPAADANSSKEPLD